MTNWDFSIVVLSKYWARDMSAFALGSFFGCALRSSYQHTKGQQLKNIRSGFALGIRALGIATVLSVSGVGLFILSVSAVLQVDSLQQFGQEMVNLCGDRFRINKGESVTTFAEIFYGIPFMEADLNALLTLFSLSGYSGNNS
ncbi:unnamed protein product [Onchocerca flexuosa]|uniref:Transmembrane protein 242 n=1 Tax=Onchocerca flexuosa TaxID=387005 RepID=A0A183H1L6_9BILA|nr:unnamed protein product [Onchocerca flexuosa]